MILPGYNTYRNSGSKVVADRLQTVLPHKTRRKTNDFDMLRHLRLSLRRATAVTDKRRPARVKSGWTLRKKIWRPCSGPPSSLPGETTTAFVLSPGHPRAPILIGRFQFGHMARW